MSSLVVLVSSWIGSAVGFSVASRGDVEAERVRTAPTCSTAEQDLSVLCKVEAEATVVQITSDEVQLDVGGRLVSMPVTLSGSLGGIAGTRVLVTFFHGEPIRAEGPELTVDADGSPADDAWQKRNLAVALLVLTPPALGLRLLIVALENYVKGDGGRPSMPVRFREDEDVEPGPVQPSVNELASQLRPVEYDGRGT